MATTYGIVLKSRDGLTAYHLAGYSQMKWGRGLNSVGALELNIPADLFPFDIKDAIDTRIEIWRKVEGDSSFYLDGNTCYFIRAVEESITQEGANNLIIRGADAMSLLGRRIIAYETGSDEATKWDCSDDIMKELVSENLGTDAANPDRDLSAYLEIAGNTSQGPVIYKTCAWENLFKTLQDIANASYQEALSSGEQFLFFDVEYDPSATKPFRFCTYIDQIGTDRTSDSAYPLTLQAPSANIPSAKKIYDYSGEINVVYALGQGYEDAIETTTATASDRINLSPFNRREVSVKIQDTEDIEELQTEADDVLQKNRPKIYLDADLLDSKEYVFGRDFYYGDRIMVNARGTVFETHLMSYSVELGGGGQRVNVKLRGEEYVSH